MPLPPAVTGWPATRANSVSVGHRLIQNMPGTIGLADVVQDHREIGRLRLLAYDIGAGTEMAVAATSRQC